MVGGAEELTVYGWNTKVSAPFDNPQVLHALVSLKIRHMHGQISFQVYIQLPNKVLPLREKFHAGTLSIHAKVQGEFEQSRDALVAGVVEAQGDALLVGFRDGNSPGAQGLVDFDYPFSKAENIDH